MKGRGPTPVEECYPATAFFVESHAEAGVLVLVTAGHVLTGEDASTGDCLDRMGKRPDSLRIHAVDVAGKKITCEIELYAAGASWDADEPQPVYRLHPEGRSIDVGVLPVEVPREAVVVPLNLERRLVEADLVTVPGVHGAGIPIPLRVTDRLFVVGFPFGDVGTWPAAIWTVGYVASEPSVRHAGRPALLIDSRTRSGQSGSPVLRRITPSDVVWAESGDTLHHEADVSELVGVYSGRTDRTSDLGIVYLAEAISRVVATLP